jgi:flavin reductase (DIM6/NTAB) family NADH-FMN oxidoreductase RutF
MDPAIKKKVLRLFTYGLYAVTSKHGDEVSAMTANWLGQVSFEPPMVALAVENDSHSHQVIEASRVFAISVFESGQRNEAGSLGRTYAKHPDKVSALASQPGPATGSPVLDIALGWVECRVLSSQPAGDHVLYVAEVIEAGLNREGTPLTLQETGFKYFG